MALGLITGGLNLLSKGKNLGGLLGAGLTMAGMKKQGAAGQTQSMEDLQSPFQRTQDLIGRMTNFSQYSAPMADMNLQAGNKAVEDAQMMGMGGSQANAIKNRLKNQNMGAMYGQYQQGLGQAAGLQGRIDDRVSSQMQDQRDWSNRVAMTQGQQMMNMGGSLLPRTDMYGEGGLLSGAAGKLGELGGWLNRTLGG
tara:strand:+ start:83 stop:670 length:588 start_codon:yes stop_codon:yes gene_type:complete